MNPLADIDNICFLDTETRAEDDASPSDGNVKTAGTYRYHSKAFVAVSTFCIGGTAASFDVSLDRGFDGDWLCWDEMPRELHEFHKRVEQREAWYAAWNAGFDREAWNQGTADFPLLEPENIVDIMAQGVASNLPPSLEGASRAIGRDGKHPDGEYLINMFCRPNGETPFTKPAEWETFKLYGRMDTEELREIFRSTRPLPLEEWRDYWTSERINRRGKRIDLETVRRAALIADFSVERDNALIRRWTNGQVHTVSQAQAIANWLYDRLPTEAAMLLVKEWDEGENEGDDIVVGKLSLARDRLDKLVAYFATRDEAGLIDSDHERALYDVALTRLYGGSSSPGKYKKMLDQHVGGKLKGSYVFNGAAQTGRFSSKGVQEHNLTRSTLGDFEAAAIEMINELEI